MARQSGKPAGQSAVERGIQERLEDEQARNELFAGKEEGVRIDPTSRALEDQTIDQLVHTAVTTHKDTTASAQRALKMVEESRKMQTETLKQLEGQNVKMQDIGNKMDNMNAELTYAEKLLSYMRRCCCCCFFDSCTGADPEEARKRQWNRRVDNGKTEKAVARAVKAAGAASSSSPLKQGKAAEGSKTVPGRRDPDIRLPQEHHVAELGLHEETRKQNEMIDQIYAGLDGLLEGARGMHDELGVQNRELDVLDAKTAATNHRINDVNKNSQLRNMGRGKPKKGEEDTFASVMPTKAGVATAAAKRLAGI